MKVLHCIPNMAGGGAERQLTYLCRALVDKGVDVHVALCAAGVNAQRLEDSGAVIHMLKSRHHYDLSILFQLIRLIRRLRPQVLQTWMYQMDVLGGIAAIATRTALVVSERTSAAGHPGNWKCRLRTRIAARRAMVIANSQTGIAYWHDRLPAARTRVIPNIVAFDEIDRAAPTDVSPQSAGPLIVAAGRLYGPKNATQLVEALVRVAARIDNVAAMVFGDGPLRESLERICSASSAGGRVRLMGYSDQLYSWLKRADVFVSASLYEGAPNSVQEAIACRCPVVVSDIAAHREFLDEDSAFFVCPESAESIADGIMRALSDQDGCRIRAQQAYARLAARRADCIAEEYIAAYEEIIGRR